MRSLAIVAGALGIKPAKGGHAWSRVSVVEGLRRLGFDVIFIEQIAHPESQQRAYFEAVCALFHIEGYLVCGEPSNDLIARAEDAAVLVNFGGHLTIDSLKAPAGTRIYLDDDPGYTQLWCEAGLIDEQIADHHAYFTFGINVGRPDCSLPTSGINWRPIRPPVVLDQWPITGHPNTGFTTVASWRGEYGRPSGSGRLYGQKAHEFRRFIDVPKRVSESFEIALDIDPADEADAGLLRDNGWRIVDPIEVAATPADFQRYVQDSAAEFSVARGVYVETHCGWFSDRTTRYLASGKPVLIQDTGFSDGLGAGEGLLTFTGIDEVVRGAREIALHYDDHAAAAREIAEAHFDSNQILGGMLEAAGL